MAYGGLVRVPNVATDAARLPRAALTAGTVLSLAVVAGLTTSPSPAGAAFPGANGRIACSGVLATELGNPPPAPQSSLEIFSINPDGTGETRLQRNTNSDLNPRYSADGTKIAFIKDNQVWTMNADGSNERGPLTGPSAIASAPTSTGTVGLVGGWSPDGTQIIFDTNRTGNNEVFKINADGSNPVNLTNNPGSPGVGASDVQPAWSPDGTKIAFRSERAGSPTNRSIFVMNADGTDVTNLTGDSPAEESAPDWSPDGRQLVFHSDRASFPRAARNLEIYRMNAADGSHLTQLTFSDFSGGGGTASPNFDLTGYDLFPHWSPAGDRIVFHSGRAPEFRDSGQAGIIAQWEAYTIDAVNGEGAGGSITRLTNRAGNDERCGWQPVPRATQQPPATPGGGGYPLPPGGGSGGDSGGLALPAGNSAGVKATGRTKSGGLVIVGSNGDDQIVGTGKGDRITGGGGRDTIRGGGGSDSISGGSAAIGSRAGRAPTRSPAARATTGSPAIRATTGSTAIRATTGSPVARATTACRARRATTRSRAGRARTAWRTGRAAIG